MEDGRCCPRRAGLRARPGAVRFVLHTPANMVTEALSSVAFRHNETNRSPNRSLADFAPDGERDAFCSAVWTQCAWERCTHDAAYVCRRQWLQPSMRSSSGNRRVLLRHDLLWRSQRRWSSFQDKFGRFTYLVGF